MGGSGENNKIFSTVEVIPSVGSQFPIPNFPKQIFGCHLFMQNGTLTAAGGFDWNGSFNETWYQLKNGFWQINTALKTSGYCTPTNMVITSKAIYTFGADENANKVRYLPNNGKNWMVKEHIEIPGQFRIGCAVEIKSKGEIWLIGGNDDNGNRILSFDLETHTFKDLPLKLITGRSRHICFVTKIGDSEVILVTGGNSEAKTPKRHTLLNSVEIINIADGSVTSSPLMTFRRNGHGIGTLNINNQPRICVFGGWNGEKEENTVEVFDEETLKWELVKDFQMMEFKSEFGYITI